MTKIPTLLEEKIVKILKIVRDITNDERISENVRGEYMDKISDILEGK